MTKIDIFSGFLGAGKTTLISKLLKEALSGEQVVLIENEFGEIGIDGGFLKEAGVEIKQNIMTFPELLNYMYRQDAYGLGGEYSVPTYNMFNLATSWPSVAAYDYAHEFTTNPDYIAGGYNTTHLYDDTLDKLSIEMLYGVKPGDYATYLDKWQQFVIRYNELLPMVPLYSNIYVSIYPNTIKGYEEGPFWGFERAILYAEYVG